jgi:uncharacterized protein (UPF0335 family)
MKNLRELSEKIVRNEEEEKFEIKGDLGDVEIPYSYVADDSGKLQQILRLLRKGVNPDTVIIFYEVHLQ